MWGEMASTWGINRTMAKIHALLYCAEQPLNTDQIMERLDVSRGNVNMNLRSLVDWDPAVGRLVDAISLVEGRSPNVIPRRPEELSRSGVPHVLLPAPRVLHHRFSNPIDLVKVFEGVSEALLPLVHSEDVNQIEQLLRIALRLDDIEPEDRPSTH
ncbi:MAG: hypothetical protein BRD40_02140 [Bacteroidetes bacterium QS_1_65_9]|nr:MAG: hypothetical protein BRD40_02140 [Bacteroidetes bacterium QS_1_65_9]